MGFLAWECMGGKKDEWDVLLFVIRILPFNIVYFSEPGYYEDKAFGIRLENIVRVKNVSLEHNFQSRGFLGFEDVTFVPYQHKLIDFSLLTEEEVRGQEMTQ